MLVSAIKCTPSLITSCLSLCFPLCWLNEPVVQGELSTRPWSMMDRLTLSRIDDNLESSEVAALCFLCLDVINRKRLEGVSHIYVVLLSLSRFPVWGIMSDWTFTNSTRDNLFYGLHQNKSAIRYKCICSISWLITGFILILKSYTKTKSSALHSSHIDSN